MQTTVYGSKTTQPKQNTISTSAYQAPTAPLAGLYASQTATPAKTPYADQSQSLLASNLKQLQQASSGSLLTPQQASGLTSSISSLYSSLPSYVKGLQAGKTPTVNDLTLDPVYEQVVAAGGRNIADANSAALAQAKNAILGFGGLPASSISTLQGLFQSDPNNPILGALSDALTQQAAASNPDATMNQLALNDQQRVGQLDQDLNNQNLYYSSTRAGKLTSDANTYRGEQSQATNDLASALSAIYANVLNTKEATMAQENNALEQAYQNALQLAALGGGPSQGSPYSYVGPNGQTVTPVTYGMAGVTPQPITSGMVQAPVTSPGFPKFVGNGPSGPLGVLIGGGGSRAPLNA